MTNFVLLYSGGGSMSGTEAEQAAVLQAWTAWYSGLGSAVVDWGAPFSPAAKSVASDGTVANGPVGALVSGYTIIKADSLDAAVQMGKSCPILKAGGRISVYESLPM